MFPWQIATTTRIVSYSGNKIVLVNQIGQETVMPVVDIGKKSCQPYGPMNVNTRTINSQRQSPKFSIDLIHNSMVVGMFQNITL